MATSVETKRTVSVLLALWDGPLLRGRLNEKVKKAKEGAKDYKPIVDRLIADGKVSLSADKSPKVALEEAGRGLLVGLLLDRSFGFDRQLGAKGANVLLEVLRSRGLGGSVEAVVDAPAGITSYEAFKTVALETFDKLNRDFNLDNLVPIYRIRRAIGGRVERSDFNAWLLEMQSNDIFQLLEGGIEDNAPEKLEDSVQTKLGKLRCYAKYIAA